MTDAALGAPPARLVARPARPVTMLVAAPGEVSSWLIWPIIISVISIKVIVHESGHYFMARAFGMRVLRYSIGIGPVLFKYQPKNSPTIFQVCAIPFLAYVQIDGMNVGSAFNGCGVSSYGYDTGNAQEVQITVAGGLGEADRGGPQFNIVPKTGGNVFSGTYFGSIAGEWSQGNNLDDQLRSYGLTAPPVGCRKCQTNAGTMYTTHCCQARLCESCLSGY